MPMPAKEMRSLAPKTLFGKKLKAKADAEAEPMNDRLEK